MAGPDVSALSVALDYAGGGRRIVPLHTPDAERGCSCRKGPACPTPGKHPRLQKDWEGRATGDAEQLRQWWDMWPEANVGIVCGDGLLVLDVDETGWELLEHLQAQHGRMPPTATVITGSDGGHFYFTAPPDARSFSFSVGLSVQAAGKLVVAPPSLHRSGRRYEWQHAGPLAPAPGWLLKKPRKTLAASNGAKLLAGARHPAMLSLAGAMRRQGADKATITAALLEFNHERCDPPKDDEEVRALAADVAGRYAPAESVEAELARLVAEDYEPTWDESGKTRKLVLPPLPDHTDEPRQCAWLTGALRLDAAHPITGGKHSGNGASGRVDLYRRDAPTLEFEPAGLLNKADTLAMTLAWQMLSTDRQPIGLTNEHASRIAFVVHRLCGQARVFDAAEETFGLLGSLMLKAMPVEGHTLHGTVPQRYEAATALHRDLDEHSGRPIGPPRYLIDARSGEVIIGVSELRAAAREYMAGPLKHGWLDARMCHIGWRRVTLDAFAETGREGRRSAHVRFDVYRGTIPTPSIEPD